MGKYYNVAANAGGAMGWEREVSLNLLIEQTNFFLMLKFDFIYLK